MSHRPLTIAFPYLTVDLAGRAQPATTRPLRLPGRPLRDEMILTDADFGALFNDLIDGADLSGCDLEDRVDEHRARLRKLAERIFYAYLARLEVGGDMNVRGAVVDVLRRLGASRA